MDWARDLPDWPLSETSRKVECRPHLWHVQEAGRGPVLLLLHGAGASTHSWRALIPRLSRSFRVVAVDLPGHGFTRLGTRQRSGLATMTEDVASLCRQEGLAPVAIVGHSAGAAVALALADGPMADAPPSVVGINPALGHFEGVAGWLFPLVAKALALNPFTANMFTFGGNPGVRARRIIESTGSRLDASGLVYYARLMSDRTHVDGALAMMAQWDISPLLQRLPGLGVPCLFIVGDRDLAVPPKTAEDAAAVMLRCDVRHEPELGHLAHEEAPELVAELIVEWVGAQLD